MYILYIYNVGILIGGFTDTDFRLFGRFKTEHGSLGLFNHGAIGTSGNSSPLVLPADCGAAVQIGVRLMHSGYPQVNSQVWSALITTWHRPLDFSRSDNHLSRSLPSSSFFFSVPSLFGAFSPPCGRAALPVTCKPHRGD